MKFGQLIDYGMGNVFHGKSYIRYCGETSPRPFAQFVFVVFSNQEMPNYIEIKVPTTCFYLIQSFFEKQKDI